MRPASPAIRLLGPSGCGKTTLAERLTAALTALGLRVAAVKSARHHAAPADRAGADTARLATAGAVAVAGVFAGDVVIRLPGVTLDDLLRWLAPLCDLVLVEGFHDATLPALVFEGSGARAPRPDAVLARVTAGTMRPAAPAAPRVFHRDDLPALTAIVLAHIGRTSRAAPPRSAPQPAETAS